MHIHILGICGTLMGSLALLAKELGHRVSGSDRNVYAPMSTQLEEAGIVLNEGYDPGHLEPPPDLVIVGNAGLPRGNPAVEHTLAAGLRYTSGAAWLGDAVLPDRWVIAVTGTHGKTTTTSMIAWILEFAGESPGFLIGGVPLNFGRSARLGQSRFFVVEGDEYDTSYFDRRSKFLHYRPRTLVFGNLEYDHADIFPDLEAIKSQFHLLLRTVPANGLVVKPSHDANIEDVLTRGCWTETQTLDFHATTDADWTVQPLDNAGGYSKLAISFRGVDQGRLEWRLFGRHNAQNALAAIAATTHAGVAPTVAIEALEEFRGVKRRMEPVAKHEDTTVYDDFAHHPTAIRQTLHGLRRLVGDDEILAVIEPASHTMRAGVHRGALADATSHADRVIWYRPENVDWDMGSLARDARVEVEATLERVLDIAVRGFHDPSTRQHIVIMSNGSFGGLHRRLAEALTGNTDDNG